MLTDNLEVILALDTSGSMEEPLAAARQAAAGFLDALPAEVPVAIVGFGPEAAVLAEATTDRAALEVTLDDLTATGEPRSMTVVHTTGQFTTAATDRVVVLLSDGGDTARDDAGGGRGRRRRHHALRDRPGHTREQPRRWPGWRPPATAVSPAADPDALAALYQESARPGQPPADYTSAATGRSTSPCASPPPAAPSRTPAPSTSRRLPQPQCRVTAPARWRPRPRPVGPGPTPACSSGRPRSSWRC